jgi:hypothetical protein
MPPSLATRHLLRVTRHYLRIVARRNRHRQRANLRATVDDQLRRLIKKPVQQGRNERRGESYVFRTLSL